MATGVGLESVERASNMTRLEDFDFDLPAELIATRPVSPRDSARCLVVDQARYHKQVHDLPDILRAGDILVFNDSRVIPARLSGQRVADRGTAKIELTLLGPAEGYVSANEDDVGPRWSALARPGRALRVGDRLFFRGGLEAKIFEKSDGGQIVVHFDIAPEDFGAALEIAGDMPLPPYIARKRPPDTRDRVDYQTVYADREGAVAAPTAGLHFTDDLLRRLAEKGIRSAHVTLHVGAGTFLPVRESDLANHKMHSEWGEISIEAADHINQARAAGGRIVAVGTTSLRLLESAVDKAGIIHPFAGQTDIFLTPGHRFRSADLLLTNFHLPKSTLFILVSAFSGPDRMKQAYQQAIEAEYRFYSYGDACLLTRSDSSGETDEPADG